MDERSATGSQDRAIHELIDAILLVAVGEPRPSDEAIACQHDNCGSLSAGGKLYDERIVGFEALVYWNIREGTVPPDSFLPSDRDGLHRGRGALGARAGVCNGACSKRCRRPTLWMSVNLRRDVADSRFMARGRSDNDSGVHARDVIVEINELSSSTIRIRVEFLSNSGLGVD